MPITPLISTFYSPPQAPHVPVSQPPLFRTLCNSPPLPNTKILGSPQGLSSYWQWPSYTLSSILSAIVYPIPRAPVFLHASSSVHSILHWSMVLPPILEVPPMIFHLSQTKPVHTILSPLHQNYLPGKSINQSIHQHVKFSWKK